MLPAAHGRGAEAVVLTSQDVVSPRRRTFPQQNGRQTGDSEYYRWLKVSETS